MDVFVEPRRKGHGRIGAAFDGFWVVPAEAEPDVPEAMEVEEEETLHYPSQTDYRDIRLDESWEPSHDPPQAAPKAARRKE